MEVAATLFGWRLLLVVAAAAAEVVGSGGVVFGQRWRLRVQPRRRQWFLSSEVVALSSFGSLSGGGNHCSKCLLLPEAATFLHFLLLL